MSTPGHNSQTVAAGQLRAFIERIERVEEEIKTLNADKSDIYKELRGVGFDVKAVRQCVAARKLDSAEREERNAIFDLYWAALTGASDDLSRARARTRENIEEFRPEPVQETHKFDPETGEIIETQESSDGMASGSDHLSADHVSPPASQAEMGGGSANKEQGYVDGSAARAGYGGQSLPLAGQIESRTKANFVDGTASLAAREGEQAAAPFPHSTVAAPPATVEQPEAPNSSPDASGANSAPVIGHVSFATSSHINPDDMPDIPDFLKRDFQKEPA